MLRLALAYLFRRPVQLFALLGVTVGLLALLTVLAVMNGLISEDRAMARGPLADLMLIPPVSSGGQSHPYSAWEEAVEGSPVVAAVSPHLIAYAVLGISGGDGILSSDRFSDINGVQLVGIDPAAEVAATDFEATLPSTPSDPARLFEVTYSDEDRRFPRPGVLVSSWLQTTLGLRPAERLEFGALPPLLPPVGEPLQLHNARFDICGTYSSGNYDLDADRIYCDRSELQEALLGGDTDFSEMMIRLRPGVPLDAGRSAVLTAIAEAGLPQPGGDLGGGVETWEERRALYLRAIENERRITAIVLSFIVLVAGFGVFATLSALVREKVRDLGVLGALGYSPALRALLLAQVGVLGLAVGTALGYGLSWLLVQNLDAVDLWIRNSFGVTVFDPTIYVMDHLPSLWIPSQARAIALASFLVSTLFVLLPALRAARIRPADALRWE